MQGKSKYYFPNNLLLAALANILGRANPNIIFPPFYAQAGFLISAANLIYKNPRLKPGVFYYLAKYFLFPA